ncbi:MAG: SDR family oxidoreductase [Chitinophagaceae bacterium]|nr:SDR family oxidoreductase [Chitinophagaceae bacterium]
MRILVTGANGFLGNYLIQELLRRKHEVIATGKGNCRIKLNETFVYEEMDFTNVQSVNNVFDRCKPQVVVHAGAMSKTDECEDNRELAFNVNTQGTINLLMAAKSMSSFFIFISTDFVFDGLKGMYNEDDVPGPVNYYGQTKLLAEEKVKEYAGAWCILRTVLVYGRPQQGRDNLLTLVKKKNENGELYKVFTDQLRTPTYVEDLAKAIISVMENKATGIFHISGIDQLSPFQMVIKMADLLSLNKELIIPITKDDLKEKAIRPPYTGFDISKAKSFLNYSPVSFDEGLKKTFEIKNEN